MVKPNARALADGFFRALNGKCAVKSTVSKNKNIAEIPVPRKYSYHSIISQNLSVGEVTYFF